MIIQILNKLGFKYKSSFTDEIEKVGYSYFEHKDEDLRVVKVEVNYTDDTLSDIYNIDVIIPSLIITNPSTERLEKILSILRPELGEIITVIE